MAAKAQTLFNLLLAEACCEGAGLLAAGPHISPRPAQTPRQSMAASPSASASGGAALLQEQLDRASKHAEAAVFRAAEAEARIAGLTAELQAAQHAEQAGLRMPYPAAEPSAYCHQTSAALRCASQSRMPKAVNVQNIRAKPSWL